MKKIVLCGCLVSLVLIMTGCGEKRLYVNAAGNDDAPGTSEKKAFKTLGKAVDTAKKSSIKMIIILGTLDSATESTTDAAFREEEGLGIFFIKDSGETEITIGGMEKQPATLSGNGEDKRVVRIIGTSNIRFENLLITNGGTGGLRVSDGATVTLGKGAEVSGNTNKEGNGGVFVSDNSSFNMEGGSIHHNISADYVGGVAIEGNSAFIMSDGDISDNEGGGLSPHGVMISEDSEFVLSGGTITNNNTSTDETSIGGGGVYINPGCTFIMSGGTINKHKAFVGAGVNIVSGGKFTMTDGTISENNSYFRGGGVHISGKIPIMLGDKFWPAAVFEMTGGTIDANNSESGGGVFIHGDGVFNASGGKITRNDAKNGGGIYVSKDSVVSLSGVLIEDNRALSDQNIYDEKTYIVNLWNSFESGMTEDEVFALAKEKLNIQRAVRRDDDEPAITARFGGPARWSYDSTGHIFSEKLTRVEYRSPLEEYNGSGGPSFGNISMLFSNNKLLAVNVVWEANADISFPMAVKEYGEPDNEFMYPGYDIRGYFWKKREKLIYIVGIFGYGGGSSSMVFVDRRMYEALVSAEREQAEKESKITF
jgi:hypothetical protein